MSGPDTSMSSAKSQPGGRWNPADEQKWHPNRHLSYYWKRDHDFLRQQVETGSIAYNTALDLEIEHCELDRTDAVSLRSPWNHFSLRPSYEGGRHSGGPEYNRYMKICDDLREQSDAELGTTEAGATTGNIKMHVEYRGISSVWNIAMHQNNRRKTLLPRDVAKSARKPRPGSFEVILSWKSAVTGSRIEAVLFSKLDTLKFPNMHDIIAYMKHTLAPVHVLGFTNVLQKNARRSLLRRRYIDRTIAMRRRAQLVKGGHLQALQSASRRSLLRRRYIDRITARQKAIHATTILQSRVRRAKVQRRHFFNRLRGAATKIQRWFRGIPRAMKKPIVLTDDTQEIETDEIHVMYHGTKSLEMAALIEQQGFKRSTGGLLGPGVYVSRNVQEAERYKGSNGVILEMLVKVGRVCYIRDHEVPNPAHGVPLAAGTSRKMVAAKDLVSGDWSTEAPWHDAGYDTAWVPEGCIDKIAFRGGASWSQGLREETCVFDPSRVIMQRRSAWDSSRAEVNRVQWMFEEDTDRVHVAGHQVAGVGDPDGQFVPFSRRICILIESHYLIYKDGRGKAQPIVSIEADRKPFHSRTGLQYEIDFDRYIQRNVMTGHERRIRRKDLMEERAIIMLQSCVRRAEVHRCNAKLQSFLAEQALILQRTARRSLLRRRYMVRIMEEARPPAPSDAPATARIAAPGSQS